MSNPVKSAAAAALLATVVACGTTPNHATSDVKYLSVNHTRLPYVEQGQGTPVVFVHGAVSDHRAWVRHIETVSNRYRAIAYTQRYFGNHAWDEMGLEFGVQTHSDDLAAFIRGLDAGPVHLVAWSYSGHIVLNIALQNPELVRSAFVFEPSVPSYVTDEAQLKAIGDDAGILFGPVAEAVEAGDNIAAVQRLIDGVGEGDGYFAAQSASTRASQLDSADTMPLLLADQAPPISCTQLGRVEVPVAIVRGEPARPFFREIADAAARCIPGVSRILVPMANHMWPGEDPQGFSEALLEFISDK